LMISLGFGRINLTFPHACGNARKMFNDVVPHYRDIKLPVLNAVELCWQSGVFVDTETIPFCYLPGIEQIAVEVYMADDEYSELKQYGSDQKIIEWNKLRLEIKTKFPQCEKCRFFKVCEGPWIEYPEQYGSDEFIPVPGRPVESVEEIKTGSHMLPDGRSFSFKYEIDLQDK